jgi:PAS domain-containing protein
MAEVDERATGEALGQPLELILARNLISIISFAAVLIDSAGAIVFFNDAAARFFGGLFEETGPISLRRWRGQVGPFDDTGRPLPTRQLPVTRAFQDGRPGFGRFNIRGDAGMVDVEVVALPLAGTAGLHGAVVVFWPMEGA